MTHISAKLASLIDLYQKPRTPNTASNTPHTPNFVCTTIAIMPSNDYARCSERAETEATSSLNRNQNTNFDVKLYYATMQSLDTAWECSQ